MNDKPKTLLIPKLPKDVQEILESHPEKTMTKAANSVIRHWNLQQRTIHKLEIDFQEIREALQTKNFELNECMDTIREYKRAQTGLFSLIQNNSDSNDSE